MFEQQENSTLQLGAHSKTNCLLGLNCLGAWVELWFETLVFEYLSSSPGASTGEKMTQVYVTQGNILPTLGVKTPRKMHLLSGQ